MTFRAYLMARPVSPDAAGEFVRLARAHGALSAARSLHQITECLEDCGAARGLYEGARAVWMDYQASPHPFDA